MEAYRAVFGPLNYAFTAGDVRFLCLNTNALEFDYSVALRSAFPTKVYADIAENTLPLVSPYELPYSMTGNSYDWHRLWINTATLESWRS